jgi:hypothetical protein
MASAWAKLPSWSDYSRLDMMVLNYGLDKMILVMKSAYVEK